MGINGTYSENLPHTGEKKVQNSLTPKPYLGLS